MVGYPFDPEKSVSGIVLDPQTLERVVPNTKRKDGTVRKELKIRPGFTPTEDVARFRSSGQRDAARLKGFVPGASSASSSTYVAPSLSSESEFPSLSKAARKNLNRRLNKKGKEELDKEEQEAEDWDAEDDGLGRGGAADTEEIAKTLEALTLVEQANKEKEEEEARGKASLRRAPRPGGGLFRELGIKPKDKVAAEPSGAPEAQEGKEADLIKLSPLEDVEDAPTSDSSPEDVPPPTLAPPITPNPATATPKSRPPKSLLPQSLLGSPSPSSTRSPASPPSGPSIKANPKSKSTPGAAPPPGSNPSSSAKKSTGSPAASPRTRTEVKTRPSFSPMGQINGLLGGGAGSARPKKE